MSETHFVVIFEAIRSRCRGDAIWRRLYTSPRLDRAARGFPSGRTCLVRSLSALRNARRHGCIRCVLQRPRKLMMSRHQNWIIRSISRAAPATAACITLLLITDSLAPPTQLETCMPISAYSRRDSCLSFHRLRPSLSLSRKTDVTKEHMSLCDVTTVTP